MTRLFQVAAFALALVATGGYSQTNLDAFPQLGAAPDPNDLFLLVDVDPVGGNSTKNVKFSNVTNHNHLEAAITDLDKYTQAEVDALLAPKLSSVTAGDVDAEASTDGYVLTSDGAGNAAWEVVSAGASALGDLTDVTITSPSSTQVLTYNGSGWVNSAATGGGGATSTAAGTKVLLEEITASGAASITFSGIPAGYERIIISGNLVSSTAGTADTVKVAINGDTTDANYYQGNIYHANGAVDVTEAAGRDIWTISDSTSEGSATAAVHLSIEDYADATVTKHIEGRFSSRNSSAAARSGHRFVMTDGKAAVTSIAFTATGNLTGTLRLYGEKSLTLVDSETITVKKKVATITDPAAGEFDFDFTDYQDGDRIVIEGTLRGDVANAYETVLMYINADTAGANYHSQKNAGVNNASSAPEHAATARLTGIVGGSAPSGEYAQIRTVIEGYSSSAIRKQAITEFMFWPSAGTIEVGHYGLHWDSTAAITRLRIRTDNHSTDTLTGTLTAYIEKEGVLPVSQGPHVIETITLSTAGEFDFDNIPSGYRRLLVRGEVDADNAATNVNIFGYINTDTNDANYHRQSIGAFNGTTNNSEGSDAKIGEASGTSAPANSVASLDLSIENYTGSNLKRIVSNHSVLYGSGQIAVGQTYTYSSVTDAVTRLRIRSTNHPTNGLTGTLTLYGEY